MDQGLSQLREEVAAEPSSSAGTGARALLTRLGEATVGNPVLVKEFRTRMRGVRAYWILLAYTLLLAGVVSLMYFVHETEAATRGATIATAAKSAGELGRAIFTFIFVAQALLVGLITPALTSGAVTIEREQRSYELLVTTPLRGADVVRGKLTAAVSFVVLLLTASLPLVSLSFLVGGVSPAEILCSYLVTAFAALVYGAVGIFWSCALRSTAAATVVTYLTVISLFVVTLVTGFAGMSGPGGSGANPGMPLQSVSPVMVTFRGVQPEYLFAAQIPSWVAGAALNLLLGILVAVAALGRLESFEPPRPRWLRISASLFWVALTLFLFGAPLGQTLTTATKPPELTTALDGFLILSLTLIVLVVPIFNTGDLIVRRGESAFGRYATGFLPHRFLGDDLSSGFPLTMGWTLFLLSLFPIAVATTGKWRLFAAGGAAYVPAALLFIAVVIGLAGVGNLLSVSVPSRWAACVLTYLAGVLLILLPWFTNVFWDQSAIRARSPQPLFQLLYLTPIESLTYLQDPRQFHATAPPLLLGDALPPWIVTTLIYLALGLVGFLVSGIRIHREGTLLQQRLEVAEARLQTA